MLGTQLENVKVPGYSARSTVALCKVTARELRTSQAALAGESAFLFMLKICKDGMDDTKWLVGGSLFVVSFAGYFVGIGIPRLRVRPRFNGIQPQILGFNGMSMGTTLVHDTVFYG